MINVATNMYKLFICPACHRSLIKHPSRLICHSCKTSYQIKNGIVGFIKTDKLSKELRTSKRAYEKIHQRPWSHLTDGSYEILAAFARGNKTIDIACGDGFVEELAPHTIGVDFSFQALLKAKKRGARFLVQATAEALPFKDNSFDVSICSGSLEHFADPEQAIAEIVRVSRIQILVVHSSMPGHHLVTKLFGIKHQPIERPINTGKIRRWLRVQGAHVVYKGVWTLPVNYGRVIRFLPQLNFLPSSSFIISVKSDTYK